MLIVCPSCTTSYRVEPASLGASGRSVRCARCRTVWFAVPEPETPARNRVPEPALAQAAGGGSGSGRPQEDWPDAAAADENAPDQDPWAEALAQAGGANNAPADDAAAGTGDGSPHGAAVAGADPAAADPVAVTDAPGLVPEPGTNAGSGELHGPTDASSEDIESFAARRNRRHDEQRLGLRSRILPALIVALLVIDGALISWRGRIAAVLPQTASLFNALGFPVNLRGLEFAGVTSTTEVQDGTTILVVEGAVVNPTGHPVDVPRLRFAVRDQHGHEIYTWTALPGRTTLGPRESLPFRSRLASPPAEGRDMMVRFFNRRDVSAAAR